MQSNPSFYSHRHSLLLPKLRTTMALLTSLNPLFPSCRYHYLTFFTTLFRFSTQIQQTGSRPFMAQYLISSFGFSEERALRVASGRNFCPIKTPDRPDSVVRFFKDTGLTDREIQILISWNPLLLSSNVEKTLKPRSSELMTAGFTGNIFIQLIKCIPWALILKSTVPVLQFWRSFLNNNEKAFLKFIKRNADIVSQDINKQIIPKMNLLRDYGVSDQQIAFLVMTVRFFIQNSPDKIKVLLEKTKNLGFQQGSRMFVHGLVIVASLKHDTIERKINFFKNTYSWSEEEVSWAINKCPYMLKFSEENFKSKVDFLIANFGFDARSVAKQPSIVTLSLKRRLIPRHYVINMLKSKGLKINYSSFTVLMMTEEKFFGKLIEPYKKDVPKLGDSYAAFLDGKMSN